MDDFEEDHSADGHRMSFGDNETLRLESDRRPNADSGEKSEQDAEARMRQALSQFGQRGLRGEAQGSSERRPMSGGGGGGGHGGHMTGSTRRHRFVQDGEVPVSVVRPRRDPMTANPSRAAERGEGRLDEQVAERTLREQAERKLVEAQMSIKALQTRLGHAELERDEASKQVRALRDELQAERALMEEERAQRGPPGAAVSAMRRPRTEQTTESDDAEPVKWWL